MSATTKRRFPETQKSAALVERILKETAKSARTSEVKKALFRNSKTGEVKTQRKPA